MAEVFARYPRGGSEMLLALAIADHAHDDGTSVRPSVRHLAEKTRQSERAVQYQLRSMEAAGWLQLVGNAMGGRNTPREYRIDPDWVKGANSAPPEKGATDGVKGCNPAPERVQKGAVKGATAIAPEPLNHQGTVKEPKARKRATVDAASTFTPPPWVPLDAWQAWLITRTKKRAPNTGHALDLAVRKLAELQEAGDSPAEVLEQSVLRGWTGLFPTNRGHDHGAGGRNRRESEAERVERINREHDQREHAAGLF